MEDNSVKLNGYKARSYGDLVAVATLLAMLISVVAWGLKLEGELNGVRDTHNARLANLEARVSNGILPRAEERIRDHDDEIEDIKERIIRLEDRRE